MAGLEPAAGCLKGGGHHLVIPMGSGKSGGRVSNPHNRLRRPVLYAN